MAADSRLLIAGNLGGAQVGESFLHAAQEMGLEAQIVESQHAFAGSRLWGAFSWRFLGHRPPALQKYNRLLREAIRKFRPNVLIATGIAPATADTLAGAKAAGITLINYLTDDPWSRNHRSNWFFRALPQYAIVFSTRRANIDDLRVAGCGHVEYLPFAYDPRLTRPVQVPAGDQPDILFVGGADRDRVPILTHLIAAGFRVAIYGGRWERYRETRAATFGEADPATVCRATAGAKVALCLVRRANRDGHVMRTFEIAAIGACVLAEDTQEHREILGETAVFFGDENELVARAAELLKDAPRRARLATALRQRIIAGHNTYGDRLREMLFRAGAWAR
jgi:spore maturation protein CgeB